MLYRGDNRIQVCSTKNRPSCVSAEVLTNHITAIEVKRGGAVRSAAQLEKDAAMESEGALVGNNGGALQGQTLKLKTVEARPF
jgi:hypothetical protein